MINRTTPLWIWAGTSNANAPTGKDEAAVVVEVGGTFRAARDGETNEGAETIVAVFVSDLAPIASLFGDLEKIFVIEGERVVGWRATAEEFGALFTSPVVSGCDSETEQSARERWAALPAEQRQAVKDVILHRRRISQIEGFVDSPVSGSFIQAAKENARRALLCGDDSPQVAIDKATAEVARIEREFAAVSGAGTLDRLVNLFRQARTQPRSEMPYEDGEFDWYDEEFEE